MVLSPIAGPFKVPLHRASAAAAANEATSVFYSGQPIVQDTFCGLKKRKHSCFSANVPASELLIDPVPAKRACRHSSGSLEETVSQKRKTETALAII